MKNLEEYILVNKKQGASTMLLIKYYIISDK